MASPQHHSGMARRERSSASVAGAASRSEEHTSELQSPCNLVCRLLLEKKKILSILIALRLGFLKHRAASPCFPRESVHSARSHLCCAFPPHSPLMVRMGSLRSLEAHG